MARLKSEIEITCPCCQSTLVIDTNLGRVVSHHEPERGNKPELSEAQRILSEEAARREAIFQQSVDNEKNRGDALSRRFEEEGIESVENMAASDLRTLAIKMRFPLRTLIDWMDQAIVIHRLGKKTANLWENGIQASAWPAGFAAAPGTRWMRSRKTRAAVT